MMMATSTVSDPVGSTVADRLDDVRARIGASAARSGRDGDHVRLVAVTKLHDVAVIRDAMAAGQVDLGESRTQELLAKSETLGSDPRWHFVGRLQRNKVADVVGLVVLVHSVDRLSLAEEIAKRAVAAARTQDVLVQVNIGHDPAKGGCPPDELPALLDAVAELDGVRATGLMTIPPLDADPRKMFAKMRDLRDHAVRDHPDVRELSMGMSGDFEVAIEEGATIVRVGEAVFGPRPPVDPER